MAIFPTFSVNDIIELIVTGQLLLNKGTDDFLVSRRKNKPRESILAPPYWANIFDIELGYGTIIYLSKGTQILLAISSYPMF